jgi:hypothetical protein
MISETNTNQQRTHLRRRILGSPISAVSAWLALILLAAIYGLIGSLFQTSGGYLQLPWWIVPAMMSVYATAFVSSAWLIILLPLYLLAPRHSPFWRWPICTFCGALAGAGVMLCFQGLHYSLSSSAMLFVASFSGATTCLIGALLSDHFCHVSRASNVA